MDNFQQIISFFGAGMIIAVSAAAVLDLLRRRGRSMFTSINVFADTVITVLFLSFFIYAIYKAIF
tara:strand:+ start:528 stop:722 length:195 start_codon:yes stop_codon:yes gene_type:complete